MAIATLYQLDLKGQLPANRIVDEKHTVSPPTTIEQANFIVARACPFFAETLVVKDGKGPTARVLQFGTDYIVTHKSIALSKLTKKEINASITFKDRNYTGSVYISYNTVGGDYTLDDYTIVEKLTREKYTLRKTTFDQIVGVPSSYPNAVHFHDTSDLVGLSQVIVALNDLTAAIRSTQGSFGVLNTIVQTHIKGATSHTPAQVGLSNVKNFDIALSTDYAARAPNKYVTPDTLVEFINQQISASETKAGGIYLTKTYSAQTFLTKQEAYTKAETDNLYGTKNFIASTYLKKTDALTEKQVGTLVNSIVDLSQYHTRSEAYGIFYTKEQADTRYYTKSQVDSTFVKTADADNRYIQTANPNAVLSTKTDNLLSIENGKLYVGLEAPSNLLSLYIDCINGSDNSPGTRSAPLRTLRRAKELTPNHKSSTWYIKYYTPDQMEKANSWYNWDFNLVVRLGAVRTLSVYNHTWIDGGKASEAKQKADGSIFWYYLNNVARMPVYIRFDTSATQLTEKLFDVSLLDSAKFKAQGICFIKPIAIEPAKYTILPGTNSAFIHGTGEFVFEGCEFYQYGKFIETNNNWFKWVYYDYADDLSVIFTGCNFGYVVENVVNGTTSLLADKTTVFGYTVAAERPFQSNGGCGKLISIDAVTPGLGAIAVGGTAYPANMAVVLQRNNMINGFNFNNGICTNLLTNLTLRGQNFSGAFFILF